MPVLPKPAAIRQRKNRSSTSAVLSAEHSVRAPKLPATRVWNPMTVSWWKSIWASPMAPEFLEADTHGLFALAMLEDDFWNSKNPRERVVLMVEIRHQRQCYGLTPIDRRRLQWQVEQGESAAEKTRRRSAPKATPAPTPADDPRLHLVS